MMDRDQKILECAGFEYRHYEVRFGGPPQPKTGWYLNGKFHSRNKPGINIPFLAEHVFPKLGVERIGWEFASNLVSCVIDLENEAYEGNVFVPSFEDAHKEMLEACLQAVEQAIGG